MEILVSFLKSALKPVLANCKSIKKSVKTKQTPSMSSEIHFKYYSKGVSAA